MSITGENYFLRSLEPHKMPISTARTVNSCTPKIRLMTRILPSGGVGLSNGIVNTDLPPGAVADPGVIKGRQDLFS